MSTVPVKSVKKALDLLDILCFDDSGDGIALSELSRRMGWASNSTHNLIKTIAACGYASQNEAGRYVAGRKCHDIGRVCRMFSSQNLIAIRETLHELYQSINEAAVLAYLARGQRYVLTRMKGNQLIRVSHREDEPHRIYDVPTGRILVAHASEEQVGEIVACNGFPGEAWDKIDDMSDLKRACRKIRKAGFVSMETPMEGTKLLSFACPIQSTDGQLLGAIGSHALEFRCPLSKQKQIINNLRLTAKKLSTQMA